jgi:hypothetical protein
MPGVEVDVRVELARDEVVVGQRDLLELQRDVEQRIVPPRARARRRRLLDDLARGS